MKLFFYDLETTGTNPGKHGIHQISGQIIIDGEVKEEFNFKVQPNPKARIEDEALAVANVTKEQILAYPPMQEVYSRQLMPMILKYIDRYNKKDKFILVGYNNAHFDNDFFRGFFLQNGDSYFGSYFWSNSIDVMVLATAYMFELRVDMPNFKQSTVATYLGIGVEDEKLHDALYDIQICRKIYDIVCGKY